MTIRALEKEVLELPLPARVRLIEKVIESVDEFTSKEIEAAWTDEIGRRVTEIESNEINGIPAAEAISKARSAINEARRISSRRRK